MDRLYVVVRADLPPGAQLAQACHAVSAFASKFPDEHRVWQLESQNLVVLSAPDERALVELIAWIEHHGIECSSFFEPDLGQSLTAFAAPGTAGKLVSSLPLALRPSKAAA